MISIDVKVKDAVTEVVQPSSSKKVTIGFDSVNILKPEMFNCFIKSGHSYFIGRIYRSLGLFDFIGAENIKKARAAGIKYVDGYIFPCLRTACPRAKVQVETALNRLKSVDAYIDMLWLSVQIHEWPVDPEHNRLFVTELIATAESMGVKVGIFTNPDSWGQLVGLEWSNASDKLLWYSDFNDKPVSFP